MSRRQLKALQALKEANNATIGYEIPDEWYYIIGKENPPGMCFDLMCQFIERCKEDSQDPTSFRKAAIYIACGCV